MEGIKTGDTVVLNSGGPLMTVGNGNPDGWYCTWFNCNCPQGTIYDVMGDTFNEKMLRLPNPDEK
jgi:uncharacterized protein YodC (DUF2158 family)